jgi:hypothetical protein
MQPNLPVKKDCSTTEPRRVPSAIASMETSGNLSRTNRSASLYIARGALLTLRYVPHFLPQIALAIYPYLQLITYETEVVIVHVLHGARDVVAIASQGGLVE